jgi:hypothetical protein
MGKLIILQAEVVKDLISTNDATIIGILLGFIALLIYLYLRTDNKLIKANEYTREQDKANLLMMQDLITSMDVVGKTTQNNAKRIEGVHSNSETILTIIRERLIKQV